MIESWKKSRQPKGGKIVTCGLKSKWFTGDKELEGIKKENMIKMWFFDI